MAAISLSLRFDEFSTEVLEFAPGLTTAQLKVIINRGYRQFLNPPVLQGENAQHRWSFLHPNATITTQAPYSTGTIAYDHTGGAAELQITLSSGTWPSWAADGSITINGTTYAVASRSSDSVILLADGDNPGVDVAAGTSYELGRQNMDLPDVFGGLEGGFIYQGQSGRVTIEHIGVHDLMEMRQRQTVPTRWPRYAAIRTLNTTNTTDDQKSEVLFYPTPDDAYVLNYQYISLVAELASNNYPIGGMMHGETILTSILAIAERKLEPAPPVYRMYELFLAHLKSSIELDRAANTATHYGYNRDNSDYEYGHWYRYPNNRCDALATYNGALGG